MMRVLIFKSKTDTPKDVVYQLMITETSITWAELKAKFPVLKGYSHVSDMVRDDLDDIPPSLRNVLFVNKKDSKKTTEAIDEKTKELDEKLSQEGELVKENLRLKEIIGEHEEQIGLLKAQIQGKEDEVTALNKRLTPNDAIKE